MATSIEMDNELERQRIKRLAGICTMPNCEAPHEGRTLYRCREHGGVMPMAARAHRSLQHTGWRKSWEG